VAAISQETREAVERDLRERWGVVGLRVIADAHGISDGSVRNIARRAGITNDDARAMTKNAAQAHKERNAQMREEISGRLLRITTKILNQLEKDLDTLAADGRTVQSLMIGTGVALDKHRMLDTYDQDRDTTEVGKFLRALAGEA
jgi:hypothetical protein